MKSIMGDSRGLTLVELMMTVAVLGIFFGVVYGFLNFNLRFMNQRNSDQDYQFQGRIAMSRVENLMRRYQVLSIDSGRSVVIGDGADLISFAKGPFLSGFQYCYVWNGTTGELRNQAGDTVAKGIQLFNVEDQTGVIKVTVRSVPVNNPTDPGQTLSTWLRKDRGYSPP